MCSFCEAMKTNKNIDITSKKFFPEQERRYSVAIVKRLFVKGRYGSQSTSTDYRYRGCGYPLNYCPECGKKMEV